MAEKIYDPQVKAPGFLKFSKVIAWLMYAWVLFGIITLTFGVFLLAFSANTNSGFYQFIAKTSTQYLEPFRGLFPPHPVGETGYINVSALFAIVVYAFVAWGFSALLHYIQSKIDLSKDTQQKAIDEKKQQRLAAQGRPAHITTRRPSV
jgi:uncharacterized protein YggT (Ycf19 family)